MPDENPNSQPNIAPVEQADLAPAEIVAPEAVSAEIPTTSEPTEAEQPAATVESAVGGTEISTGTVAPQDDAVPDAGAVNIPVVDQPAVATTDDIQTDITTQAVDDTAAFPGDSAYIREVKQVIRDDKDKPYEEEEDSEAIQKDYLAKRFGVKAELDKEQ